MIPTKINVPMVGRILKAYSSNGSVIGTPSHSSGNHESVIHVLPDRTVPPTQPLLHNSSHKMGLNMCVHVEKARTFFILLFFMCSLTWTAGSTVSGKQSTSDTQRSKEANCLIQGYHTCLLHLLSSNSVTKRVANPTTSTPPTSLAPTTHTNNTNAADCFRLSRASTGAHNRSSTILCKEDECPWDGACLKSGSNNENDGFHTVEDLPIATFYENVHTITISFPKYLDSTVLYVLETRPICSGGDSNVPSVPFRFAGVSNQTTISYRVFNICHRYEFRPTAILSNGSVITFLPKTSNSNPPDFMVDNIRMSSLRFNPERHQVTANLTWKHPYGSYFVSFSFRVTGKRILGYTSMDVDKYESYLHTLQCDAPSDLLNDALTDTIIKTDEGGTLTATFPEIMVERKCQFRFMVWASSACGNRTLTDAKIDIVLNCSTVEGYKCPAAELRPICLSHVDISTLPSHDHSQANISVNISWTPTLDTRPQYYHVRWGPARLLDLRQRSQSGAESDSSSRDTSSEHHKIQSSSKRRAKSLPVARSKSQSREGLRKPRNTPDFSIWMLIPDLVTQEKVAGDTSHIIISNLSSNAAYGVQVCAIFNGDFKRPDWPKVAASGFTCTCSDPECSSPNSLQCNQKSTTDHLSAAHSGTTSLPTIRPPLAIIVGVPQPPENIDTVSDFTQTLVSTEPDGIRMRLTWKPPKNLLKDQVATYAVSVETLLPCEKAPACCDYVDDAEIDLSQDNVTGNAELFLPRRVLHSHCEFVAKITTTAINRASSVSLKNIRVPPIPPPLVLRAPDPDHHHSNSSCHHLQCSHTCNATQCLCPLDLVLSGDGRSCVPAEELMPNDSPATDCIAQFGCYYNLCDMNGCLCPEGYNISEDGVTCVTNTPSGAIFMEGETISTFFDYCQNLGCKFSCTPNGNCVCPSNMKLGVDGKSCDYKDPDVWNSTAPPPRVKAVIPSIICASASRQLFTWTKDGGLWLKWKSNSSAFSSFGSDSEIRVRLGTTSGPSDGSFGFYHLDKAATVTSTSLTSESLHLPLPSPSDHLGIQFCIYNSHQWAHKDNDSLMNWDIVPIIIVEGEDESSGSEEVVNDGNIQSTEPHHSHNHSHIHSHTKGKSDLPNAISSTDSEPDFKKTIAMAVVIPVSCIIILASLLALLCYFHPTPIQKFCPPRFRPPNRPRLEDGLQKRTSGPNADGRNIKIRDIVPPQHSPHDDKT